MKRRTNFEDPGVQVIHTLTREEVIEGRANAPEVHVVCPQPYYGGDAA